MFKMLPVVSSDNMQQAVYNLSANFDRVTSTETWADLNSVSHTDCLIFCQSLVKNVLSVCEKGSVSITEMNSCF